MTSYHISLGYNSGYSGNPSDRATWGELKRIAESITPDELKVEYLAYENLIECVAIGVFTLDQFIEQHFKGEDASINYVEDWNPLDDDAKPYISLSASGGCDCRTIKEGLRRAFCRLMLHKAHQKHIEICINVA